MNKIELRNPIMINGVEVKELSYNTGKISSDQFCAIDIARMEKSGGRANVSPVEFDHVFHFYLGCAAVIAVNPHIDIKDLERVTGWDIIQLTRIGQNFTLAGAGGSTESDSGAVSETTQEPLAPQSES